MSAWSHIEADKAFGRAARARRRALLACRIGRRRDCGCGTLAIHDGIPAIASAGAPSGVREIAVDAISATVEPNRAAEFDDDFRPAPPTRERWKRVWIALERGVTLPPISVVQVGDAYAVRDGHHRVSVAKARGVVSISAVVAAA
jgi:hypothetical protein